MKILQLTVHYPPNIGGVETHLSDLVSGLVENGYDVFVLTYRPLTAKVPWTMFEKKTHIRILRLPWIAGFFYQFVHNPIIEFLYLFPGLFLATAFVLLFQNSDVIHAHGLVAGSIGVFWGKIFRKRVVVSTHSIYHFPQSGMYASFVRWMFQNSDHVLCLSQQSKKEIGKLGILSSKISVFTYWVDQTIFTKIPNAQKKLQWGNMFTVLFIGRLVEEKGIPVLLQAAGKFDKSVQLILVGAGPLEDEIKKTQEKNSHIQFIGALSQKDLPLYYSAADILVVPSTSEEGFGRVILEALSCELPILAANRGGIPEAVDSSVAECIEISPDTIADRVNYYCSHREKLKQMSKNAEGFAKKHYNKQNIHAIINSYEKD